MGCIYVISMQGTDFVKIGYTDGLPEDRLKALQSGSPFRLKVLKTYPCTHAAQVERLMHRLLRASHHDREWFVLPEMDALDTFFLEACEWEASTYSSVLPSRAAWLKAMGLRMALSRNALGLSQKELAKACGFPYQVINRVENGHQDLYAQRLARIAEHLKVSTDYLLGLKDTPDD